MMAMMKSEQWRENASKSEVENYKKVDRFKMNIFIKVKSNKMATHTWIVLLNSIGFNVSC